MNQPKQQQTVQSLAGEEVMILDDAEFAELAGFDPESHSFKMSMGMQRSKLAILKVLWRHGTIVNKSGFAVGHLADRIREFDQLDFHVTAVLTTPLMQVAVERVTRGKRTMKIQLVALPRTWLQQVEGSLAEVPIKDMIAKVGDAVHPAERELLADPITTVLLDGSKPPEPVTAHSPEPVPVEMEVANAVATALMARVVEIISHNGSNVLAVKNAQLGEELIQTRRRLGEQTAYVDRLRRELRAAQDEVVAAKLERDGLRQRAQQAEHNLKIATGADAQRLIDAEVHKQVDRLMRQAPGSDKQAG